jgi:hypothetical protein
VTHEGRMSFSSSVNETHFLSSNNLSCSLSHLNADLGLIRAHSLSTLRLSRSPLKEEDSEEERKASGT